MSFIVPSVDISPYVHGGSESARHAVVGDLDHACREVGFVQILGHGIPDAVIAGLTAAMDRFFGRAPEDKERFVTPPQINRGYAPPKSEATSLSLGIEPASRMNDFFEAFNVGLEDDAYPGVELDERSFQANVWTDDDPTFRTEVWTYFLEARRVAVTLTDIFREALGVTSEHWDELLSTPMGTMRMNNYALTPGMVVQLDGDLRGMGEHTDYGVVTVLWADQVRGLQVLGADGDWHDVSPADGALLVNLGDVSARWTNERWMSTLHRVKPPVIDGQIERRRSAAYFHSASPQASAAPLAECVGAGEEPLYDDITVSAHAAAKLAGSRAGIRNVGARREAARVLSAQAAQLSGSLS